MLSRLKSLAGVYLTHRVPLSFLQHAVPGNLLSEMSRLYKLEQTTISQMGKPGGLIDSLEVELKLLVKRMSQESLVYKMRTDEAWVNALNHAKNLLLEMNSLRVIPCNPATCTTCGGLYPVDKKIGKCIACTSTEETS